LSKFWFAISKCLIPPESTPWLRSVVTDVKELVPNEIWEVITVTVTQGSTLAKRETFYVLEPTCEVIGCPNAMPASLPGTVSDSQRSLPIRVDWSEYVNDRILPLAEPSRERLLDRVQWAHYEEYQNGISRHFLTRTQREGEVGELKRRVAEKYVLASVVENRYDVLARRRPKADRLVALSLASAERGNQSRKWPTNPSCPWVRTTGTDGQR
jgi:hypothetical protein